MNIRFNNNSVAESSPKESIIHSCLSGLLLKKKNTTDSQNYSTFFISSKKTDLGSDTTDLCLEWVLVSKTAVKYWEMYKNNVTFGLFMSFVDRNKIQNIHNLTL